MFSFNAQRSGQDWSPRLAFYGDLGSVNAKSIRYLQEEAQQGKYDAILHVGKFRQIIFWLILSAVLLSQQ